ncbi:MAG: hypothetical protein HKN98_01300, partial [Silicimonas sp.]|nr:hypothetical protein [Silicimonas sp.]
ARIKDKFSNSGASTGMEIPDARINTVFETIFASERQIVKNCGFPFGLSIVAVATPRAVQ